MNCILKQLRWQIPSTSDHNFKHRRNNISQVPATSIPQLWGSFHSPLVVCFTLTKHTYSFEWSGRWSCITLMNRNKTRVFYVTQTGIGFSVTKPLTQTANFSLQNKFRARWLSLETNIWFPIETYKRAHFPRCCFTNWRSEVEATLVCMYSHSRSS